MKYVSLISSGIDSAVATYLMSKKTDEMILIHANNQPFIEEIEIDKFLEIVKHLNKILDCKIKTIIVENGPSLLEYRKNCDKKFTCVFCKRMMLRYAEKIAEKQKAIAIVMGDSLGQVASQTLQNIKTIEQAVNTAVIRPLIGFDKQEIIEIAKKIGTYEISILHSIDCTAVPYMPSTQAKLDKIVQEESKIDISRLVNQAIKRQKIIKI